MSYCVNIVHVLAYGNRMGVARVEMRGLLVKRGSS
jgi:hypothetical protein